MIDVSNTRDRDVRARNSAKLTQAMENKDAYVRYLCASSGKAMRIISVRDTPRRSSNHIVSQEPKSALRRKTVADAAILH